jgi:hypothetical protein
MSSSGFGRSPCVVCSPWDTLSFSSPPMPSPLLSPREWPIPVGVSCRPQRDAFCYPVCPSCCSLWLAFGVCACSRVVRVCCALGALCAWTMCVCSRVASCCCALGICVCAHVWRGFAVRLGNA